MIYGTFLTDFIIYLIVACVYNVLHNRRNDTGSRVTDLYALVKPEVTDSIAGVSHTFRIVRIIIPVYLIKQPTGSLSRM